jgi:DNA polymerase-3 subunit delta
MRLDFHKLSTHLKKQSLLPVYLVAGDEPFQHGEALDKIRQAARTQGYQEREILEQDTRFAWPQLAASGSAPSLFGNQRLIELRLSTSKIGKEGSEAVVSWFNRLPEDAILLISSPKLERSQGAGPKWIQAVEQHGGLVNIWPVNQKQLAGWLEQRLRTYHLIPEPGVAVWLAERVEGNLLAGAQEVAKLALLQDPGSLSLTQAINAVSDSARYSIFDLADSAIDGQADRCLHVLHTLQDEGTASALILWVLTKEVRLLTQLAFQVQQGMVLAQAIANRREIREQRRPSYARALAHFPAKYWQRLLLQCAQSDRAIKGINSADPWNLFEHIVLGLCGITLFHKTS